MSTSELKWARTIHSENALIIVLLNEFVTIMELIDCSIGDLMTMNECPFTESFHQASALSAISILPGAIGIKFQQ